MNTLNFTEISEISRVGNGVLGVPFVTYRVSRNGGGGLPVVQGDVSKADRGSRRLLGAVPYSVSFVDLRLFAGG